MWTLVVLGEYVRPTESVAESGKRGQPAAPRAGRATTGKYCNTPTQGSRDCGNTKNVELVCSNQSKMRMMRSRNFRNIDGGRILVKKSARFLADSM